MDGTALGKLQKIVGEEFVLARQDALSAYAEDMTENPPSAPEAAVFPATVEEVSAILRLANEYRIPVTPIVSGANMSGLTIPVKGGIMLDLKRMNRILLVDPVNMFALLEPSVTFGQLKAYLEEHHPALTYGYPLAPPYTSVMCNALLDGLTSLSHPHGSMGDWINGLEVVLPTGEVARCGAWAVSAYPYGRGPLPDLVGLFLNWQGVTGVVTKISVQVWPKPLHAAWVVVPSFDERGAFELMREASKLQAFSEVAAVSWAGVKAALGARGRLRKVPGEPEFYVFLEISGSSELEVEAKRQNLNVLASCLLRRGLKLEPPLFFSVNQGGPGRITVDFSSMVDSIFDFERGGLTWVGCYGPVSEWEVAARECFALMERSGFPPLAVMRAMKGGHFGVLRLIISFNKSEREQLTQVRRLCEQLLRALLKVGFIPYKTPGWAAEILLERADRGYRDLLQRVKRMLDPNGVMNPGRLGL